MEIKIIKKRRIFSVWWFVLFFIFLVFIVPATVATFWVKQNFSPVDSNGKEKIFVIKPGESMISIGSRLKTEGLIRDANAFRLYARFSCENLDLKNPLSFLQNNPTSKCLSGNIQAGSFKLSPKMSLSELSQNLTKGRLDSWTKIVEGLRNEEIAAIVAKNYSLKEEDFLKESKIGYMFPDTYLFNVNSSASQIAAKMRQTFDLKFTTDLQEKIKNQNLTIEQGLILASILERESRDNDERPVIAGILIKRFKEGWRIEADATVQYAVGYDNEGKTWWKKSLTDQDLKIDSPYNTRKNLGLPPGPICNPGLSALKAVANPKDSEYYFYLHDKDGKVHFAKTLQEHNDNKVKFL